MYRIEENGKKSKAERAKVINAASRKQRMLLIHVLHHVMAGGIPLLKVDHDIIVKSGKLDYLEDHFEDAENSEKLLQASDSEQKTVLTGVNNYHVLLRCYFHKH